LSPFPAYLWVIGVLLVAAGAAAATWLLVREVDAVGVDMAPLRVDAIRTGLTVGAGLGAALVLVLSIRRQLLCEASFQVEAFTKAVDQLAGGTPVMRLGAIYALESLAQNDKGRQQAVVDVLCGYLRLPFVLSRHPELFDSDVVDDDELERRQELRVRLTAQEILARHLGISPRGRFWPDMVVDLRGAALIDFSLTELKMASVRVLGASFRNRAASPVGSISSPTELTRVAQGLHRQYRDAQIAGARGTTAEILPEWDDLDDDLKKQNIATASALHLKLSAINCGLAEMGPGTDPELVTFTDNEVEVLAAIEHERWVVDRQSAGWVYGPDRDNHRKRHPLLKPFETLAAKERRASCDSEQQLPATLLEAGFEVRRLPVAGL
jgi:hypothetical protein